MRINNLVAKGAEGKIRSLRDQDKLGCRGFVNHAAVDWPKTAEDAEQGRFSTAVRSDNEQMLLKECQIAELSQTKWNLHRALHGSSDFERGCHHWG